MSDERPIPDQYTAMPLSEGYYVAWCVGSDGEAWPWIVAALCGRCQDAATHGSRYDMPIHERLGRLPQDVRDHFGLVYRCGAPTRRGTPCQIVVTEAGQHCGVHTPGRYAHG